MPAVIVLTLNGHADRVIGIDVDAEMTEIGRKLHPSKTASSGPDHGPRNEPMVGETAPPQFGALAPPGEGTGVGPKSWMRLEG